MPPSMFGKIRELNKQLSELEDSMSLIKKATRSSTDNLAEFVAPQNFTIYQADYKKMGPLRCNEKWFGPGLMAIQHLLVNSKKSSDIVSFDELKDYVDGKGSFASTNINEEIEKSILLAAKEIEAKNKPKEEVKKQEVPKVEIKVEQKKSEDLGLTPNLDLFKSNLKD